MKYMKIGLKSLNLLLSFSHFCSQQNPDTMAHSAKTDTLEGHLKNTYLLIGFNSIQYSTY